MHRKLTRKEKTQIRSKEQTVITQGKFVKRSSYLLILIGLFCAITVLPSFEIPDVEIGVLYVVVFTATILFFVWMFIWLPIDLITTKKVIIIDNKQFTIESNRKKSAINTSFDNLIWWKKTTSEWGDVLILNFDSKKISLSSLEFPGLHKLEKLLRHQYVKKESR